MAKTTEQNNNKNDKIVTAILSDSGIKVVSDFSKATAQCLIKNREVGGFSTAFYVMAEISTFDGEKIPAPELREKLSAFDLMDLEEIWASQKKSFRIVKN